VWLRSWSAAASRRCTWSAFISIAPGRRLVRLEAQGAVHLAAGEAGIDQLAAARLQRAQLLRQAQGDVEIAVIDRAQLPGERAPGRARLVPGEGGHAGGRGPLPKGYELNGYRIEKTIGGGGFSLVYLATALGTDKKVVIKEYLPSTQSRRLDDSRVEPLNEEFANAYRQGIKRFFDEASALAKVNHPNIVRVENFFRANNTVYMVMRHEQGKDLRWYIKSKSGNLSEKFIRTVFPKLLLGLRELHNNRLLHLDIKPANIFLRPGGKPLLLDFGAAQGSIVGNKPVGPYTLTMGFAPIEQHMSGHLGPWTDMYAIGASMWSCISGRPPPPATERAIKDTYKPAVRQFARRYSQPAARGHRLVPADEPAGAAAERAGAAGFSERAPAGRAARARGRRRAWGIKLPWRKKG
jgi:tRNA A-37 threonylcarbamoyl transferase component Bud32